MGGVATSLLLAIGQLADRRVLAILLKSLAATLVLFVIAALAGWYALDWGLARAGLGHAAFTGAGEIRGAASLLLAIAGLWLTWRIVAMAVIQFFADEVVEAVEKRHYPAAAARSREVTWSRQLKVGIRATARALALNLVALPFAVLLLVTGVGTVLLFWLVNALLLGRELQEMVALRHREGASSTGRAERFLLGGAIAALLLIPLVNFLAPVLGAAAATHLFHRKRASHAS